MKADVTTLDAKKAGTVELPDHVFGLEPRPDILQRMVRYQLAKRRSGTAHVKDRSEINASTAKIYRQKGTGRARHGSIRSPIWVGGGSVFGPKPRDYSVRVNKKMRKAALRSALADKANADRIWILDGFEDTKTKAAAACIAAAGIEGRALIVLDPEDESSRTVDRAFRNLDHVAFSLVGSLSTYDVLVADALVFTSAAFDRLAARSESSEASS